MPDITKGYNQTLISNQHVDLFLHCCEVEIHLTESDVKGWFTGCLMENEQIIELRREIERLKTKLETASELFK